MENPITSQIKNFAAKVPENASSRPNSNENLTLELKNSRLIEIDEATKVRALMALFDAESSWADCNIGLAIFVSRFQKLVENIGNLNTVDVSLAANIIDFDFKPETITLEHREAAKAAVFELFAVHQKKLEAVIIKHLHEPEMLTCAFNIADILLEMAANGALAHSLNIENIKIVLEKALELDSLRIKAAWYLVDCELSTEMPTIDQVLSTSSEASWPSVVGEFNKYWQMYGGVGQIIISYIASSFPRFPRKIAEKCFTSWSQSSAEPEAWVKENIEALAELYEYDPYCPTELFLNFGIRNFARYPIDLLIRQHELALKREHLDYGIIANPHIDITGAFTHWKNHHAYFDCRLPGELHSIFVEIGSPGNLAMVCSFAKKFFGKRSQFNVILSHGDKDSLQLAAYEHPASLFTYDTSGKDGFLSHSKDYLNWQIVKQCTAPRSPWLLHGCSTGAEANGFAEEFARFMHAKVIALNTVSNFENYYLHQSAERQLYFSAVSLPREAKVIIPRPRIVEQRSFSSAVERQYFEIN